MDNLDLFLINMHKLLGHEKTAFYLGVPPGNARDCLLCLYEKSGSQADYLNVVLALMGVR